jgi:poly [ADP-ribose] polymerase 2/3/4
MAIVKTARLSMADVEANSNKFWYGYLHDDGTITSENGRVGVTKVANTVSANGEVAFDRLVKSKIKKGYKELKTVGEGVESGGGKEVAQGDLKNIATKQIKTLKPELQKLIDRLVAANVHKITSSTNITYNDTTGLFSTPLGIVTLDAIQSARGLLVDISKHVELGHFDNKSVRGLVGEYLQLIPSNVGMKLDIKRFLPDMQAIRQQNDLLDSLESSFNTFQTQPKKDSKGKDVPEEKVFDVTLDLLDDAKEFGRIEKFYQSNAQSIHVSSRLKIVKIYKLEIAHMAEAFKIGIKVGNVRELWHGTKKANLLSILKSGLKVSPPSTATIAGKMFGNGIYFSDQSTKSLNYAYGYWDGKYEKDCFMLLNDVAMGKEYTPSGPSGSLPKAGYDSTFAKAGQSGVGNNEMIVYNDNQVNIKYLVEFHE